MHIQTWRWPRWLDVCEITTDACFIPGRATLTCSHERWWRPLMSATPAMVMNCKSATPIFPTTMKHRIITKLYFQIGHQPNPSCTWKKNKWPFPPSKFNLISWLCTRHLSQSCIFDNSMLPTMGANDMEHISFQIIWVIFSCSNRRKELLLSSPLETGLISFTKPASNLCMNHQGIQATQRGKHSYHKNIAECRDQTERWSE